MGVSVTLKKEKRRERRVGVEMVYNNGDGIRSFLHEDSKGFNHIMRLG